MTPVKQTKFSTESENGNCMAAALASLLDLDISLVPAFEERQDRWKQTLLEWLSCLGLTINVFNNKDDEEPPRGYAIATGVSSRGIRHAVVVLDGAFVHDPHPSNDYLADIQKFWVISPGPDACA